MPAAGVRIKIGPLPVSFPNTEGRRAALLPHDLHHVATGYATTLVGEAEIGAWELGSGCQHYYAAWILNMGAVLMGLVLAPRRVGRAFRRGLGCTNLYHLGVDARWPHETVGALRERLRLRDPDE
jgi:ubiquinone biosynthesis protein Coq4